MEQRGSLEFIYGASKDILNVISIYFVILLLHNYEVFFGVTFKIFNNGYKL